MFVNFNILNQLGSPAINSNLFANRPAAGQTGRLFVSVDTFEIYRDNGTGWDLIGGPGTSTVTGTGAVGQVTYWTGTNSVGGENNLWWDAANNHLGINTNTPGVALDVHSAADVGMQLNGTGATPSILQAFLSAGVSQYQIGYNWNSDINYRRFSIYDSQGSKEVISIDQQSRFVGINYQYSSLADQPAYTLDVAGSIRSVNNAYFVTGGIGNVGINTVSPLATTLMQLDKTDDFGIYLNYTTVSGTGTTATALWAINNTNGSGYSAVIEEKTPNTTAGQYPLAIKHSLSTGVAGVGMGTGVHFLLPDNAGTFKTTQLTIETTDAAAATFTTRYRFMAQVNGASTPLAYLTSTGLGINGIPTNRLSVNGSADFSGSIITGNPVGGTARTWKLGSKINQAVEIDDSNYVEVEINGVALQLALVISLSELLMETGDALLLESGGFLLLG